MTAADAARGNPAEHQMRIARKLRAFRDLFFRDLKLEVVRAALTDALAVADDLATQLPQRIVALVQSDPVWFGNSDFATFVDRPLTHREVGFAAGRRRRPSLRELLT